MIQFNFNNNVFFQKKDILTEDQQKIILRDVEYEIKNNYCVGVPLYQTYNNMHRVYNWKFLFDEVNTCLDSVGIKNLELKFCWANVSKPESNYPIHSHNNSDLSVVYYLQNPSKNYGTLFQDGNFFQDTLAEIIICAPQNSLLIFNPKISHSVVSPPPEISQLNSRCSIAMDFCCV